MFTKLFISYWTNISKTGNSQMFSQANEHFACIMCTAVRARTKGTDSCNPLQTQSLTFSVVSEMRKWMGVWIVNIIEQNLKLWNKPQRSILYMFKQTCTYVYTTKPFAYTKKAEMVCRLGRNRLGGIGIQIIFEMQKYEINVRAQCNKMWCHVCLGFVCSVRLQLIFGSP